MLEVRSVDPLPEVKLIVPARHEDERGFFVETWNEARFAEAGIGEHWVQDNLSLSRARGVLRGLHIQVGEAAQAKLVRVSRGSVFDVAVDVRPGSPTHGRWCAATLSANNGCQLYVPTGFAHGFLTLELDTEVQYKVSASYSAVHERVVRYDDPAIAIEWPDVGPVTLAPRDRDAPLLSELEF